jgi:beta-mannosidase
MFMDCWPSVTWSVISYDRRPKAGYLAMQNAYQPVLVGAEIDREIWRAYYEPNELPVRWATVVPWIVNDQALAYPGAQIAITLRGAGMHEVAELATVRCDIPADGVLELARVYFDPPQDWASGACTLRLELVHGQNLLSANEYEIHLLTRNAAHKL